MIIIISNAIQVICIFYILIESIIKKNDIVHTSWDGLVMEEGRWRKWVPIDAKWLDPALVISLKVEWKNDMSNIKRKLPELSFKLQLTIFFSMFQMFIHKTRQIFCLFLTISNKFYLVLCFVWLSKLKLKNLNLKINDLHWF